jgi:hypothetical protein
VSGGGGIKIKNPIKSVTKAVSDVAKTVGKAVKDPIKEIERVVDKNKDGINATAGVVARGALASATGGASETLGVGNLVTQQFGGSKDTAQLGELAGLAGGGANATNLFNASRKIFSQGQQVQPNYVLQQSGGQNMNFLDDLGGLGLDYARNQLGLNTPSKDKKVSSQPTTITVPSPQNDNDNDKKMLLYVGGGLAVVVAIILISKRG